MTLPKTAVCSITLCLEVCNGGNEPNQSNELFRVDEEARLQAIDISMHRHAQMTRESNANTCTGCRIVTGGACCLSQLSGMQVVHVTERKLSLP